MKTNGELTGREALVMTLATGLMYGGAVFILVFDNPVIACLLAALNFLFWVWVAGFFVMFGKDTVFGPLGVKKRVWVALTFWLYLVSKRYHQWMMRELKDAENSSCTYLGEGI